MQPDLPKRLAAETVGTFGFFFAGFCGITSLTTQGPTAIQAVGIAAGFGFGLALMIFAFGHLSGGHFNPAVTLGLTAARRFAPADVLPYWAAQLVGGLIAALLIRILFTKGIVGRRPDRAREGHLGWQGARARGGLHLPVRARGLDRRH